MHHGFRKIILFNSHGGNQAVMQLLLEDLGYKYPEIHLVGLTWWTVARDELTGITEGGFGATGHACEFETALMKIIAPHLVNEAEIVKGDRVATFEWAEGDMLNSPRASYFRTMKSMTPNGVYGDPTLASPEKGDRITVAVIEALKKVAMELYLLTP